MALLRIVDTVWTRLAHDAEIRRSAIVVTEVQDVPE